MEKDFLRFGKGLAVYSLGSLTGPLVGLLLIPIYTRFLTPADYGLLGLILAAKALVAVFANSHFMTSIFRHYFDHPRGSQEQRDMVATGVALQAVVAALFAAAFYLAADWVAWRILDHPASAASVRYAAASLFLAALTSTAMNILRAEEKAFLYVGFSVSHLLSGVFLNIWFVVFMRIGVEGILLATLCSNLLLALALFPMLRNRFSGGRLDRRQAREHLRYAIPLTPSALAAWFQQRADRFIGKLMLSNTDLGVFVLGQNIGEAHGVLVRMPMNMTYAPFVFSTYRQGNAPAIIGRIITYVTTVSVLLALGMGATAEPLLLLIAKNPEFLIAWSLILPLTLASVFEVLKVMVIIPLSIAKRTEYVSLLSWIAAFAKISISVTFMAHWGVQGAAWASAFAFALHFALARAFSRRFYAIPLEWKRLLRISLAALLAYSVAVYGVRATHPVTFLLLRGSACTAIFFAALCLSGFFLRGEIAWGRRLLTRILGSKAPSGEVK